MVWRHNLLVFPHLSHPVLDWVEGQNSELLELLSQQHTFVSIQLALNDWEEGDIDTHTGAISV